MSYASEHPELESVEQWCNRVQKHGWTYKHTSWPKTLFQNPYHAIISFLDARFRACDDQTEYYGCIPYLTNDVAPIELFVRWEDTERHQLGNCSGPKKGIARIGPTVSKLPSSWGKRMV